MAHSSQTCAALSGLVGWSSQSFLWTLSIVSISRGDMQATLDQLQVQPYLLPHRRIGCKLGCSSGETKNGNCALDFPALLHFSGQRRQPLQAARLLIQLATRDGRPPGPTLGDLRPVPRFTASPQESADGLLALATRFAGSYRCRFDRQTGQTGQTGQTRQTGHRGVMLLTLRGQPETGDVMY